MTDAIGWVAAYLGFIALVMAGVHCMELGVHARDEAARNREADGARGEVESVPVHATYVSAREAHVRDK